MFVTINPYYFFVNALAERQVHFQIRGKSGRRYGNLQYKEGGSLPLRAAKLRRYPLWGGPPPNAPVGGRGAPPDPPLAS
jgi:hypothetical protein